MPGARIQRVGKMGDPYFHGIYSLGKEVNKRNHKETKIIVIAMKETYGVLKVSQRWEEAS